LNLILVLIFYKDKAGNLRTLVHILVTTPGRLVHHLRDTDGLDLSKLRFLVVDEADRVMDSAQSDWLFHLEKHIAKNRLDGTSSSTKTVQ
jgi:superfamily II DNA/RNA helicase